MTYDPNSDENWFFEYTVGQTNGGGWGVYGELGNEMYRDEQKQRRKREEQLLAPPQNHSAAPLMEGGSIPADPDIVQTKNWSTLFAIVGTVLGIGLVYDQADANVGTALVTGLIGGYLSGRFYKLFVGIGIVAIVLWIVGAI